MVSKIMKMRKFKCTVTIEKEVIVWLPDEFLSTNEISSFEASMFNVGSSETGLVEYIAEQVAKEVPFIEGIGAPVYQCTRKAEPLNFSGFVCESDVYVCAKEVKDDNT